ncbi:MAG: shikimate dehydrogenase [Francisellaceae bacterium]
MRRQEKMKDHYFVIGYPVKHSLSPAIQQEFIRKTGQEMSYEALEIKPDELLDVLHRLRVDERVKGLSVTLPFKELLYRYCDELDEKAKATGAVSNVLIDERRQFKGFNLDGLGLIRDIELNHNFPIRGKKVLIIGAGGAAKGILPDIIAEAPASIRITNRTLSKAVMLASHFQDKFQQLDVCPLEEISGRFDLVINATSASVEGLPLPLERRNFNDNALAYDLMYAPTGTVFTNWCQQQGIAASDGKGMLLELSKVAFYLWRDIDIAEYE